VALPLVELLDRIDVLPDDEERSVPSCCLLANKGDKAHVCVAVAIRLLDTTGKSLKVLDSLSSDGGFLKMADTAVAAQGEGSEYYELDAQVREHLRLLTCKSPGLGKVLVEAKCYREGFWRQVQRGTSTHHQAAQRFLSFVFGHGEGANRTEVLCHVADLMGLHDPEDGSTYSWRETYRELLPAKLSVQYGMGACFKKDKEWQGKKEANVVEALVGELSRAGHKAVVQAIAALCLVTYVDPPLNLLPSNWYMSQKRFLPLRRLVRVVLRRAHEQDGCGFKMESDSYSVLLKEIEADGPLETWNIAQLDGWDWAVIEPGSQILEANGEATPDGIIRILTEFCKEPVPCKMVLEVALAEHPDYDDHWSEVGQRHLAGDFSSWALRRTAELAGQ